MQVSPVLACTHFRTPFEVKIDHEFSQNNYLLSGGSLGIDAGRVSRSSTTPGELIVDSKDRVRVVRVFSAYCYSDCCWSAAVAFLFP